MKDEINTNTFTDNPEKRTTLVLGGYSFSQVTEVVSRIVESKPTKFWLLGLFFSLNLLGILGLSIAWLIWKGVGIWGVNNPTGWGWAIVNFVFWVGIAHAGTLISAILFLLRQNWRTSINRFAEAMTLMAVCCAGIFPGVHIGRVWAAYYMFPIPNQMGMWPNFRSPLLWDMFAVGTYAITSLLFWYVGLIPDLATLRDRAKSKITRISYGLFALGWSGANRHWQNYEKAYMLLAGLATPLVLSVHTIVSFDFAVSILPGWHTTIFPPYFVAGAIFSGFAMVITLMTICRKVFSLENLVTIRHLENMNKIILFTGSIVGYAYAMEFFIAWYSGVELEKFAFINRALGDYYWAYWTMISCNVLFPQLFWFKKIRTSIKAMFIISILVNIGMWFERFVITMTLSHDFIPSSWAYYSPSFWDASLFLGSWGLFLFLFFLFIKFLPMVAISEIKGIMPEANPHYEEGGH